MWIYKGFIGIYRDTMGIYKGFIGIYRDTMGRDL